MKVKRNNFKNGVHNVEVESKLLQFAIRRVEKKLMKELIIAAQLDPTLPIYANATINFDISNTPIPPPETGEKNE